MICNGLCTSPGAEIAVTSEFAMSPEPPVAEWSKALESDASAGGESPVRAPVRAATVCP